MSRNEGPQDDRNKENQIDTQSRERRKVSYFDYSLLFVIIFLICFGFLMMYSASSFSGTLKYGDSRYFLNKQLKASFLGLLVMIGCMVINYNLLKKFSVLMYGASLVMVTLVWSPIGMEFNGARRWISVLGMSFQPAEFVKLTVIIITAHYLTLNYKRLNNFVEVFKAMGFGIFGTLWVGIITKNMSSAIIIMAITFVMVFVASKNWKEFILMGLAMIPVAVAGIFLAAFRAERFKVWLHPVKYSSKGGYQILQGLYAIGSGGILGKGLGQSVQKLGYIPEAQNDYVFAIICEELGLVGAFAVIFMFMFIIYRMYIIANNAPNLFASMMVVGVMTQIAIQVILNIAVVTKALPNTGVTLPFISYGGTSVLFLMFEIGIVLGVSRTIRRIN
ncbi:MAG: putative lipid II flippase FtsW [Lachnospiraceae bacterium]|nr:putative lipid II flippase FtsW [Lachnospiraceae bacterium]